AKKAIPKFTEGVSTPLIFFPKSRLKSCWLTAWSVLPSTPSSKRPRPERLATAKSSSPASKTPSVSAQKRQAKRLFDTFRFFLGSILSDRSIPNDQLQ